ncbi:uncharacterized protein LOC143634544 [Bidens hawaiensis]|uniref:uncharacterized protein LOC143634544 n=1 Tax=Bidens hawaiensis TaxID=980011 RepID=UPI00404A59CB
MREFFAYRLQDRPSQFSLPLNGRRLFQQLLVDKYTMVESQRLHFIRGKQSELRSDTYESLRNLKTAGNSDVSTFGQRVILPSSFTGGSRYMMQNYLDAMCLCRWPDILCRIFKMKLDLMIKLLKDKALFGKIKAAVYTIEFQKHGLPHAHICLFIDPENKIHNPSHIDNFISSEIPKKVIEPDLYQLVLDHMLHSPCGEANPSCSCMIDRECSKNFPKRFQSETSIDSQGFPIYKRRHNGGYVIKKGINLDNRSVVPYNKILLQKYQAHINVEWCNQEGSIKYLFKYINKVLDRATISLVQNNTADNEDPKVDEIKAFYDCRYLSTCEAAWRIFAFDVHYRVLAVTRLPFHLPGQQVIYGPEEDIEDVITKTSNSVSMFTGWMEANRNYEHGRKLSYAEFPTQDACYRRGLIDDDKEYIEEIEEASHTANRYYLRNLFATMHITSSLSRPDYVWDNTWHFLVDGIIYHQQKKHKNPCLSLSDEQLKNLALLEIEEFLVSNSSSLRRFSHMSFPDQEFVSTSMNPLMMEELSYDKDSLSNDFKLLYTSLTDEQKSVYNEIFNSLKRKKGGVFFVYGYGGGRTAHSRFLIPINLTEDSQCQVKGNTDVSELVKKISLIIWDEATMIHKHAFEALDITLKDVMNVDLGNTSGSLFGGKIVVLIKDSLDPMSDLIDFVYPSMLEEWALLAPLNDVVQEINDRMLAYFPGQEIEYLSLDSTDEVESVSEDFDPTLYSPDFLNGIKMSGMPNHRLLLKVGVPIMLLRNISQKKGLCNGTRLQVVSLGKRVIEAKVLSGTNIGFRTLIRRISLTPSDKKLPFKLKRRQFPISVCFAMTINKSQGQSLACVGLYLKDPVFTHGQLYVALSRMKTREARAHLDLENEVAEKVKWLLDCQNYESDFDDFQSYFGYDSEV